MLTKWNVPIVSLNINQNFLATPLDLLHHIYLENRKAEKKQHNNNNNN